MNLGGNESLSRVKEKKERLRRLRMLYLFISIYIIFITLCIFQVDYTFNDLTTGIASQSIFKVAISKDFLNITFLGQHTYVTLKGVNGLFKSLYK